jgi:membrane protein
MHIAAAPAKLTQRRTEPRQSWSQMVKTAGSEWVQDDATTWAAAIACYALLALAPMLVIAIRVGVVLGGQHNAVANIENEAAGWMGADAAKAIATIIDRIVAHGGGVVATIISSVLVLVSVSGVFSELQAALNRVWELKPKPGRAFTSFIVARVKSVGVMIIAAIILLGSIIITTWLEAMTRFLGLGMVYVIWVVDVLISIGMLTLIFGVVYKIIPDAEIEWRSTWVGALITAVLFQLGKYGLALYFKYAAPASAFGAVGSLAAVLIWIYYSAQIVLYGAVLTQVYAKSRGMGVRPSRHAQFLSRCDETETATPSGENPQDKPARPGRGQPSSRSGDEPWRWPDDQAVADFVDDRTMADRLVAGLSLIIGGVLAVYSVVKMRRAQAKLRQSISATRLDERLKDLERKHRAAGSVQ